MCYVEVQIVKSGRSAVSLCLFLSNLRRSRYPALFNFSHSFLSSTLLLSSLYSLFYLCYWVS